MDNATLCESARSCLGKEQRHSQFFRCDHALATRSRRFSLPRTFDRFALIEGAASRAKEASKCANLLFIPDGIDGYWNSVAIAVGTPPQYVRVFVSTASQETWVVNPTSCIQSSNASYCDMSRGETFNYNASKSFDRLGTFDLSIETQLGYTGDALFGYDNITLGYPGQGGPSLSNMTVGVFGEPLDYWLGIFGVNPKPTNFTNYEVESPSFITTLKNNSMIPKGDGFLGSLVLGGYDAARFGDSTMTFNFAPDNSRDLVIAVIGITYDTPFVLYVGNQTTAGPAQSTGFYAYIDSTVADMWLPLQVCTAFEQAFNLTYDNATDLYLVNQTQHTALLQRNPTFTFNIATNVTSGKTLTITFPYAAFDLIASPPYQGLTQQSYYFPIRRATSSNQYTLGRAFLQEAYLSVDWERSVFNVSQCVWQSGLQENIVTIEPLHATSSTPSGSTSSTTKSKSSLSDGAIAGIVIGAVTGITLLVLMAIFVSRRRQRASKSMDPSDESSTSTEKPTNVIPKAELDGTSVPVEGSDSSPDSAEGTLASSTAYGSRYSDHTGLLGSTNGHGSVSANGSSPDGSQGPYSAGGRWPAEAEAKEREIYEMPGDEPKRAEMAASTQPTQKEQDIARERLFNGVDPRELTAG
ncbi:hypothetical protein MRB53_040618 [Persea americana]|nr:hypothetical protein MRB53_040618 [Persea americana]